MHPLVRDKDGKKMSKSLGNVIDPLHIIHGVSLKEMLQILKSSNLDKSEIKRAEKSLKKDFPNGIDALGADSLRFALASYLKQGRQINIDIQRVVTARQFCNKIWHASRYVISNVDLHSDYSNGDDVPLVASSLQPTNLENQWILNRLHETIEKCEEGFSSYNFALTTDALRSFFINDFCDVYLELTKKYLNPDAQTEDLGVDPALKLETQLVLKYVLDASLRLLHPILPFITEDLFEALNGIGDGDRQKQRSIMMSPFPSTTDLAVFQSTQVRTEMETVLQCVHGLRSLRSTMLSLGVQRASLQFSLLISADTEDEILTDDHLNIVKFLSRISDLRVSQNANDHVDSTGIEGNGSLQFVVDDNLTLGVSIDTAAGPVKENLAKEMKLLAKREKKIRKQISSFNARMSLEEYHVKVPEHVQRKDRKKLDELKVKLMDVEKALETLNSLTGAS